jgi:rootletin
MEHNRLLKMWKDIVSIKRTFKDMAATTKMDLGKLRCEITGTTREVSGACSSVSANIRNANKIDVLCTFYNINVMCEKSFFLNFI